MPGRIRDEDVALVKERADLGAVIGEHVTLRPAGGGNLKGLCPFHDEKTPSMSVRPGVGAWHCFGCGEGGDVISFLMRIEHLQFGEAVERLADRFGVQLRYEQGGAPDKQHGRRGRLTEATKAAARYYAEQLRTPAAVAGRQFLAERGFDESAAERFGVGWAPRDWDALVRHLRGNGFSGDELLEAGLAREGQRGLVDRFVGRLLWPIRDLGGDVVGFGARRLYDDDRIEAKYVNTPETALYKKSQVLYGIDLARREIARAQQAVVVEGYTDVMACHLAGVTTAVATCGTAFGDEHVRILRRLLVDRTGDAGYAGRVTFLFDGDRAGQEAARRAFAHDQSFAAATFVAVEPGGLDPCELRQQRGDAAVVDLVDRRVPLFEFAIRSSVDRFDLDTAEGRTGALAAGAAVVAGLRDPALRDDYARQLAGWVGHPEPNDVVARVRAAARRGAAPATSSARPAPPSSSPPSPPSPSPEVGGAAAAIPMPPRDDVRLAPERETLVLGLQAPHLLAPHAAAVRPDRFVHPAYRLVAEALAHALDSASPAPRPGDAWTATLREAVPAPVRPLVSELAVDRVRVSGEPDARYVASVVTRLEELAAGRTIADLKSRLQRLDAVEQAEEYGAIWTELVGLEAHRRMLRDRIA